MSYNSYPGNSHHNAGALNAPQMPGYPPQSGYPGASQSSYPGQQQSYPPPPGPPSHHHSPQPHHASLSAAPPVSAGGAANVQTNGNYDGVQYSISYRDSNSILSLRLQPGYEVKAKPGAMVAMDASVRIKGKVSFTQISVSVTVTNCLLADEIQVRSCNIYLDHDNSTLFPASRNSLQVERCVPDPVNTRPPV